MDLTWTFTFVQPCTLNLKDTAFQQVLEKIQNLREIRIWKSYVKKIRQIEVLLRIFSPFVTVRIFWSHLCPKPFRMPDMIKTDLNAN